MAIDRLRKTGGKDNHELVLKQSEASLQRRQDDPTKANYLRLYAE